MVCRKDLAEGSDVRASAPPGPPNAATPQANSIAAAMVRAERARTSLLIELSQWSLCRLFAVAGSMRSSASALWHIDEPPEAGRTGACNRRRRINALDALRRVN